MHSFTRRIIAFCQLIVFAHTLEQFHFPTLLSSPLSRQMLICHSSHLFPVLLPPMYTRSNSVTNSSTHTSMGFGRESERPEKPIQSQGESANPAPTASEFRIHPRSLQLCDSSSNCCTTVLHTLCTLVYPLCI